MLDRMLFALFVESPVGLRQVLVLRLFELALASAGPFFSLPSLFEQADLCWT